MSTEKPTLDEFVTAEPVEPTEPSQPAESRPQWAEATLRCECGADVSEWHRGAERRRIRRHYATIDGRVPACPSCVDQSPAASTPITSVVDAVAKRDTDSSAEVSSEIKLLYAEVMTDE